MKKNVCNGLFSEIENIDIEKIINFIDDISEGEGVEKIMNIVILILLPRYKCCENEKHINKTNVFAMFHLLDSVFDYVLKLLKYYHFFDSSNLYIKNIFSYILVALYFFIYNKNYNNVFRYIYLNSIIRELSLRILTKLYTISFEKLSIFPLLSSKNEDKDNNIYFIRLENINKVNKENKDNNYIGIKRYRKKIFEITKVDKTKKKYSESIRKSCIRIIRNYASYIKKNNPDWLSGFEEEQKLFIEEFIVQKTVKKNGDEFKFTIAKDKCFKSHNLNFLKFIFSQKIIRDLIEKLYEDKDYPKKIKNIKKYNEFIKIIKNISKKYFDRIIIHKDIQKGIHKDIIIYYLKNIFEKSKNEYIK